MSKLIDVLTPEDYEEYRPVMEILKSFGIDDHKSMLLESAIHSKVHSIAREYIGEHGLRTKEVKPSVVEMLDDMIHEPQNRREDQ